MRISDWSSDVCSSDLAECVADPIELGDIAKPPFGVTRLQRAIERPIGRSRFDVGFEERAIDYQRSAGGQQFSASFEQPGGGRPLADVNHVDAQDCVSR